MRSVRRLTGTALAALGVLAGGLALTAAPALAGNGFGSTSSFGSKGSGEGQFEEPDGVAVNDATGDVYVVDKGNNRVEYFSATGTFLHQFSGKAIDGAPLGAGKEAPETFSEPQDIAIAPDGDVYVSDHGNGVIDKFTAMGEYVSRLGPLPSGVLGIAVDSAGNVWVYEENAEVSEYSEAGKLEKHFNTGRGVAPGLAVDSSENVYLVPGATTVSKWNPTTGTEIAEFSIGVRALAVAPSTNDLFVADASSIAEWSLAEPYEKPLEQSGSQALADDGGKGIAISTTGTVYVTDAVGDKVDIFGEGQTPEAPLTEAAKEVAGTTAVLHGELNPKAKAQTGWYFAYDLGASCTSGERTPFEAEAEVQATREQEKVTGLEPSSQYTFCFVAENTFGPTYGPSETFTTAAAPPAIDSESISGTTSTTATLEAQINPNNEETKYAFEYSTSEAEVLAGKGTPVQGASAIPPHQFGDQGFGDQGVSVSTGAVLTPGTTYYYRVVAENEKSEEEHKPVVFPAGSVQEFTTVPAPTTDTPSPIGTTTATFNGKLTPLNALVPTEYYFDYNLSNIVDEPTPACTNESRTAEPSALAGTGSGAKSVSIPWTGLQPNHEYTVCLVSSNGFGSVEDPTTPAVTFKTLAAPPKFIPGSESAAAIPSETGPTEGVGALVNPNNEATTCTFEYGTEPALTAGTTTSVPCEQASLEGFGPQTASAHIEGLTAGATYYYRVLAENAQSKTEGKAIEGTIEHFTTPAVPTVTTGVAQGPARTSIVLAGTLDPNGVATSYEFVYIDEVGYQAALADGVRNPYADGATTAIAAAGEGTMPVEVEVPIKSLLPGTTYHYALVASSATGTITGQDETFTTAAATPPLVTTGSASAITLSTATIAGTLSTQGLDVSYAFEVSTEPGNPGPPSGGGSIGAGITEAGVSVALQGLRPGTTYYYRLLATSTDGTSYGELQSFTTPGFPSSLVLPATPPLIGTPSIAFPTASQDNMGTGTEKKTLTRAQKLAAALEACNKKAKSKRAVCRASARRRYGPQAKKKAKSKAKKK